MTSTTTHTAALLLRLATAEDADALSRLAELDSADQPAGRVLLAIADGRPVAALELASGAVIADPFVRTSDHVAMLRERASRIDAAAGHGATASRLARARRFLTV